jgi:RHS repeat-associated protein
MTTTYRYGQERLAEVQGGSRTWSGTDALGSVRQTLTDTGTASAAIHYDPWGTPTEGTPPTFGFTGELHDATSGLVHLRARWYLPAQGAFASRDPFAGFPTQPYSLHPYQYSYSNPVSNTDPSGHVVCPAGLCPISRSSSSCPLAYAWDEQQQTCVRRSWVSSLFPETTNPSVADIGIGPMAIGSGPAVATISRGGMAARSVWPTVDECLSAFRVLKGLWWLDQARPVPTTTFAPSTSNSHALGITVDEFLESVTSETDPKPTPRSSSIQHKKEGGVEEAEQDFADLVKGAGLGEEDIIHELDPIYGPKQRVILPNGTVIMVRRISGKLNNSQEYGGPTLDIKRPGELWHKTRYGWSE